MFFKWLRNIHLKKKKNKQNFDKILLKFEMCFFLIAQYSKTKSLYRQLGQLGCYTQKAVGPTKIAFYFWHIIFGTASSWWFVKNIKKNLNPAQMSRNKVKHKATFRIKLSMCSNYISISLGLRSNIFIFLAEVICNIKFQIIRDFAYCSCPTIYNANGPCPRNIKKQEDALKHSLIL